MANIEQLGILQTQSYDCPVEFDIPRMCLVGNLVNFFGAIASMGVYATNQNRESYMQLYKWFCGCINRGWQLTVVGTDSQCKYIEDVIASLKLMQRIPGAWDDVDYRIVVESNYPNTAKGKSDRDQAVLKKFEDLTMDFDYIIQNPPYDGTTHLDFLIKGIELVAKKGGKMTIIEPFQWLADTRICNFNTSGCNGTTIQKSNREKFEQAKKLINGHVYKVVFENCNREFNISNPPALSMTYIDMGHTYPEFDFYCFGEHTKETSLDNCNMIGDLDIIGNIVKKINGTVQRNKYDYMVQRTTDDNGKRKYCAMFVDMLGNPMCKWLSHGKPKKGNAKIHYTDYDNASGLMNAHSHGEYPLYLLDSMWKKIGNSIAPTKQGDNCIWGTQQELENWNHFVFNNTLPLFLSICFTIDCHNHVKGFVPFLVDKQYTDAQINKLFGFNQDEIDFMEKTVKKFEHSSAWFRRFSCGK